MFQQGSSISVTYKSSVGYGCQDQAVASEQRWVAKHSHGVRSVRIFNFLTVPQGFYDLNVTKCVNAKVGRVQLLQGIKQRC